MKKNMNVIALANVEGSPLNNAESYCISTFYLKPHLLKKYNPNKMLFSKDSWYLLDCIQKCFERFGTVNPLGMYECGIDYEIYKPCFDFLETTNAFVCEEHLVQYMEQLNEAYKLREAYKAVSNGTFEEITEYMANIQDLFSKPKEVKGTVSEIMKSITTKGEVLEFKSCDFMNEGGFEILPHTLNIISTWTSKGKTAFAMNLAFDLMDRYKVLYFNLENPIDIFYTRYASMKMKKSKREMRELTDEEKRVLTRYIIKLQKSNIRIEDATTVKNLNDIKSVVVLECEDDNKPTIVFIDNVNNVRTLEKFSDVRLQINHITKELISLKLANNCTIFALCQLRRNEDENKVPTLNDLKESSTLAEDADNVFLLRDFKEIQKVNENDDNCHMYELLTPKSRGDSNICWGIIFNKTQQRFYGMDRVQVEEWLREREK